MDGLLRLVSGDSRLVRLLLHPSTFCALPPAWGRLAERRRRRLGAARLRRGLRGGRGRRWDERRAHEGLVEIQLVVLRDVPELLLRPLCPRHARGGLAGRGARLEGAGELFLGADDIRPEHVPLLVSLAPPDQQVVDTQYPYRLHALGHSAALQHTLTATPKAEGQGAGTSSHLRQRHLQGRGRGGRPRAGCRGRRERARRRGTVGRGHRAVGGPHRRPQGRHPLVSRRLPRAPPGQCRHPGGRRRGAHGGRGHLCGDPPGEHRGLPWAPGRGLRCLHRGAHRAVHPRQRHRPAGRRGDRGLGAQHGLLRSGALRAHRPAAARW
mmetsp:Transcript_11183/g.39637  ORF Transcript_11183/g.39637 Transcript_11183/m.39637 type:complete len:324 (-) Transcript_11183:1309-2280(-)